tara:strand:- start:318 stop:3458 length:3141 start_codon:yes stop_codon:yes gene_type:complete
MYLENIHERNQVALNFWGINELYSSNCGKNKIVVRLVSQSKSNLLRNTFSKYECDTRLNEDSLKLERLKYYALQTGSISIAAHYLAQSVATDELDEFLNQFSDKWTSDLSSQSISLLNAIKNRTPVSAHFTDYNERLFILYSLLYSDYVHSFFATQELDSIIKKLAATQGPNNSAFNQSLLNYNLLKAAYETDRYQYISSIFDELIKSEYYPNSEKKVGVFSGLDYSLSITGNYSESLYLQRNVLLPLATHYNLKSRVDYILLQQSANLYVLGNFSEAKLILESLYNDQNSYIPKSQLYNNLSLSYQKLGEKNKYTSFLLQAIQEIETNKLSDSNYYTVKLGLFRNLFVYYNSIGDSLNAISYINRAKSIAEKENDNNELAAIYLYLGDYYWKNFKDSDRTLQQYEKAEVILKNIDNYRRKISVLTNKSSLFIKIDSLKEATSSIKEIKNLASENSDTPLYIEALIFEGEIASKRNDLVKFESVIDEIKIYSLEDIDFEVLIRYHNLYASLLHKKGLHREAYSYFKPVMDQIIDRAKGSVDAQTGFWTVEQEYLDAFELMVSILTDLGSTQESIAYLDRLKTINDASLYNNPLLRANKLTEKELAEEKKLTARIQKLRTEFLGATSSLQSSLKIEIDKLSAQKQMLVNKVNSTRNEGDLPIWKIQQQMPSNELIIHYTELNDNLYVSTISKSSIEMEILTLDPEVKSLLTSAADNLASGKTSLVDLFEIFNFLKLQDIPDHISHISVIPDNELYRIPLDVLPTKKPNSAYSFGSAHYLIEDFGFKYFTSLKDYAENNRMPSNDLKNDFSAFAISYFDDFKEKNLPSLPFATQEARDIQEVLTSFDQKKVFSGNNATEEAFKEQLNTSRIIHVATHSEVSAQDPLFSTIYLKSAETNGTEGNALYAYELFDNPLNNELIMLNSCSSGTGNYLQGTGIMGISRALRYAGAKSLALNLWEVNDKIAAEFATDFYSYLNQGFSKSKSMRLAKIDQLKNGSADPHYWGAYTLIGNSSPIVKNPTSSQYILPLLLTVGLLVGYKVRSKSEDS